MNTTFILMAQYGATAIVPIERVCADYFRHLTPEKLIRKVSLGEIALPLVRIEASSKCAKGVHLLDLARWIDERAETARRECRQLCGQRTTADSSASKRAIGAAERGRRSAQVDV